MTTEKPVEAPEGVDGETAPRHVDARLEELVPGEVGEPETMRKFMSGNRRRFLRNVPGVISLMVIAIIVAGALVGPFFTQDPNRVDMTNTFATSGVLGTDNLGRDIFARLVNGAQVALFVSFVATALGLIMAMILGMSAGYYGGMVDEVLSRIFDVILTFPMILLGILIVIAIGPSLLTVSIAIAVAIMPRYGRQFRAQTMSCVQREYVQAVRAQGYSSLRIIVRHVLPNIWIPIAIIAAGNMGKVAVSEASLSFLGAGVQAPDASWGNMISEGQQYLQYYPGLAVYPGLVLCALAISFSYVGDALRDAFDLTE